MPLPAVSSLGGFRTPAAVRGETFWQEQSDADAASPARMMPATVSQVGVVRSSMQSVQSLRFRSFYCRSSLAQPQHSPRTMNILS